MKFLHETQPNNILSHPKFHLLPTDIQNPRSKYKPYYDILPRDLSHLPLFWSDDELKWLEGSPIIPAIESRRNAITNDYLQICKVVPRFPELASLEAFVWR